MAFVSPKFERSDVNRAGRILASPAATYAERRWASEVLTNWRASHAYPLNTFQATLRFRLAKLDPRAIVAQRLKRAPSVVLKLQRFPTMHLAQMQDIGGLRAIVSSVARVRKLEANYRDKSFKHVLVNSKDYIAVPKPDGYRSVHLVYRYVNRRAKRYKDLLIELQIRTRLQHAWATAVETMGTFLGEALKAGQGPAAWREFFATASAAIAHVEGTPSVPAFEGLSQSDVVARLITAERQLHVLDKLRTFAIAGPQITAEKGLGSFHLIVLDSTTRTVSIRPFALGHLEQATAAYAEVEERTQRGEAIEAVLVSAGRVEALRRAYPNYFLDTEAFVSEMERLFAEQASSGKPSKGGRTAGNS